MNRNSDDDALTSVKDTGQGVVSVVHTDWAILSARARVRGRWPGLAKLPLWPPA
jgi:hypothetical protein